MNKTTTYIIIGVFISSLFLSVFIQTIMLLDYSLEKEAYIEQYCENKDKPELHCEGHCHLSKELKMASNDTSKQSENNTLAVVFIFSFQDLIRLTPPVSLFQEVLSNRTEKSMISHSHLRSIFRPPAVLFV